MSGHEMRSAEGVTPEQQSCARCNMTYLQFVENGRPRCPGRPHTNADLWPDIRVKPRPDEADWMQWARTFAQRDCTQPVMPTDPGLFTVTSNRLRSWSP